MPRTEGGLRSVLAQYLPSALEDSVEPLPVSALTGESWRLQGAGFALLAREASGQKTQLGVDRRREFRLLRALDGSGLAPHPRGITAGWLLVEWLPGEPMDEQGWQQALTTGTLASTLARLHQRRRPPTAMRQTLLHMDVHQGNVLHQADGALSLIDWEYAGDEDIALELAALFCGNAYRPRTASVCWPIMCGLCRAWRSHVYAVRLTPGSPGSTI